MPESVRHLITPIRQIGKRADDAYQPAKRVALRLVDWSPWCRQVVQGVQAYAHEKSKWQLFVDIGDSDAGRVLHRNNALDGILTQVLKSRRAYRRLLDAGTPKIVSLTAFIPSLLDDVPSVRIDDSKIAAAICQHLLRGGYRRLAYWGRVSNMIDFRAAAMRATCAAADIPCSFTERHSDRRTHVDALRKWLNKFEKPVGIVAWNMNDARQVVDICLTTGIAVPADVAVVAWDDDPLMAEAIEPTISAAVLPAERLGYESARLLDRLMAEQPISDQPVLVQPSGMLRVRQSSDASTLQNRDVYLAAQFIREHAVESIRVDTIAKAIGISRRKLEKDFKRVTGHTLHQKILQARVEQAKLLLVESALPLDRVAKKSGLGTRKTLRLVFRQLENMTPSEYRKRFGNQ